MTEFALLLTEGLVLGWLGRFTDFYANINLNPKPPLNIGVTAHICIYWKAFDMVLHANTGTVFGHYFEQYKAT